MAAATVAPAARVAESVSAVSDADDPVAWLAERPSLQCGETVDALSDEVARLVHVDLARAERLAGSAEWLAERLGDERCRGRALRASAHVLFARAEHAAAVGRYTEARSAFERLGDEAEIGRTLSSSLQSLLYLGRYAEAEQAAAEARAIFERQGDRLRLARLDTNLANFHYRQDRFADALALYQAAYRTFATAGQPHDVAVALRNIAVCHISLNDFASALEVHRRARAYCAEHGLHRLVVEADYNIAYLYYLKGEYTTALELYQQARTRAEGLGDAYHRALCDLDQSELYLELNLVEEGIELADQAHRGFEALGMRYETAKALTNLATGLGRQGEPFRALELLARTREMFVAEGNAFWPALIDAYRALMLQQEGRHFEARRLAAAALAFFEAARQPSKAALCELMLARIHLSVGELVSARRRCQSALERLQATDAPDLTYRAYLLLGQIEEALGAGASALAAYREARDRIENLRTHLEQDELKVGFLADKLAVYESLVYGVLCGDHSSAEVESAFRHVEESKSRSLADLLAFRASVLPGASGARSALVEQVHGLRQGLNWYHRHLELAELGRDEHLAQQAERLREESRRREKELLRLLREAGAGEAEFASVQAGRSADLETVRSTLPADATLLEYYEARDTVLAVVLSHRELRLVPLTPASRVRHLMQLLRFQLSKFQLGAEYLSSFGEQLAEATSSHLRELYDELVRPLRGQLRSERLVVVPHDVLHYLPFHALLDGDRALVEDFVVSYAPSAGVYHLCCLKQPRGSGSLVLGVPDADTPHITREAEAVAAALPGARLFMGEQATEMVLRRLGPASRFVHIATHGRFRSDNPMFSSVRLGTSSLSLFDLYHLDLPAELVTLSGCGTGLNVMRDGDELLGLVRGLLYAGTQSALVTLWDVGDRSTAEFMTAFYGHLGAGLDKGRALQAALLETRNSFRHPYFWAPFVLVGRGA
jgi:CHAT domain-containing protein